MWSPFSKAWLQLWATTRLHKFCFCQESRLWTLVGDSGRFMPDSAAQIHEHTRSASFIRACHVLQPVLMIPGTAYDFSPNFLSLFSPSLFLFLRHAAPVRSLKNDSCGLFDQLLHLEGAVGFLLFLKHLSEIRIHVIVLVIFVSVPHTSI